MLAETQSNRHSTTHGRRRHVAATVPKAMILLCGGGVVIAVSLLSLFCVAGASWGDLHKRHHYHHQRLRLSRSSSQRHIISTSRQPLNDGWSTFNILSSDSALQRLRGGGGTDEHDSRRDMSVCSEPIVNISVLENNDDIGVDVDVDVDEGNEQQVVDSFDAESLGDENNNIEIVVSVEGNDETIIHSSGNNSAQEGSENTNEPLTGAQLDQTSEESDGITSSEAVTNDSANTLTSSDSSNDDNDDDSASEETLSSPSSLDIYEIQSIELRASASNKRALGKTHHDNGNLKDAAVSFREAAMFLDEALGVLSPSDGDNKEDAENAIVVERATCRLHEALCLLKDGRPVDCVEACTDVLEDGVTVVPLVDDIMSKNNKTTESTSSVNQQRITTTTAAVVKIIPATTAAATSTAKKTTIPAQIRARAHHRRAKARLALGDLDGALEDARSAAFMGDRNAVQFYGRLMREGSATANSGSTGDLSSHMGGSNPILEGFLGGMGGRNANPLLPSTGSTGSSDFTSSLLSSLLTGSSGNPMGLMGELFSPQVDINEGKSKRRRGRKKKGGIDSLAKSVLSNIMKRIEDEETQERICGYLQSTNKQQIMQFSTMAGVSMNEENALRLAGLANGITPRGIRKGLRRVKRGLKLVKTARKVLKVIDKYKPVIILAVLLYWIRSAILEPYPISKKKQKLAQKAAFILLIMPTEKNALGNVRDTLIRVFDATSGSVDDGPASDNGIEEELKQLQYQLTLIEALEERNKAQIESFIDEEDQWNAMEDFEKVLISRKEIITHRMEQLTEELVLMFMGEKAKNG